MKGEVEDVIVNNKDVQRIIRNYYEKLHANKLDSLE
jgi:hypothetical protein